MENNAKTQTQSVDIVKRFMLIAESLSEEIAITYKRKNFTYGTLIEDIHICSTYLYNNGVRKGSKVGIHLNRDYELIVHLFSILYIGAAYIPIDKNYPLERKEYIAKKSNLEFLITDEAVSFQDLSIVYLDNIEYKKFDALLLPQESIEESELAYIIFTSGTTGNPKGVKIKRSAVGELINWISKEYTYDELSGVLFSTSICFDLSIFEIFGTLCNGGRLIIADSILNLKDIKSTMEVSLINTVPSAINSLLSVDGFPSSLRVINLAGERLSRNLVDKIYNALPKIKLYNLYGPSEDTTYSTCALVERNSYENVTIGKPLPNTEIYILDKNLNQLPNNVVGEIFISSKKLSLGYVEDKALTDEKFVDNPFDCKFSSKMYKTGDLGYKDDEGKIYFKGRNNSLIKFKGFRIELSEIEINLEKIEGFNSAVAILVNDKVIEPHLVAYIETNKGTKDDIEFYKDNIKSFLPSYMIPTKIVALKDFTLNVNGKVDRKKLPNPFIRMNKKLRHDNKQLTNSEILTSIWKELLNISSVNLNDNFFGLGGDSLLAMRLLAEIQNKFKINISVKDLFNNLKFTDQLNLIYCSFPLNKNNSVDIIGRKSNKIYRSGLTNAQKRMWIEYIINPNSSAYVVRKVYYFKSKLDINKLITLLNN